MKYVYQAIFTPLHSGEYDVRIPDLPGCITCGKNLVDAIEMAEDAVAMWLCDAEDNHENIPAPSEKLTAVHPQFINLIVADTENYRRENDNRAIKKTLTIPNWLNSKAEKAGVNFSQLLQLALLSHLGIENRSYIEKAIARAKTQTKTIRPSLEKLEKALQNKKPKINIQRQSETMRDKNVREQ